MSRTYPGQSRWVWWAAFGTILCVTVGYFVRGEPAGETDSALAAVDKLERAKDAAGLANLIDASPTPAYVVARALGAYGRVSGREGRALVESKLADQRWPVRAAAARALGDVGTREDGRRLAHMLEEKGQPADVKMAIFAATARLDAWAAVPAVIGQMDDADPSVRRAALAAFEAVTGTRPARYDPANDPDVPRPSALAEIEAQLPRLEQAWKARVAEGGR